MEIANSRPSSFGAACAAFLSPVRQWIKKSHGIDPDVHRAAALQRLEETSAHLLDDIGCAPVSPGAGDPSGSVPRLAWMRGDLPVQR